MSKRTIFTTVTPLPAGVTRETVMETLHSHVEMIDLNPLVEERHPIKPPPDATAEEYHCLWYSLTDRVQYLPGGLMSGNVSYSCCFHDLGNGLQTHCYAPMGLDIRGKWTLGGSLPGEPVAPVEMGANVPSHGLWLREDVDMKCNIVMTNFVKKTLKKSHLALVDRLVVKAQILDCSIHNASLNERTISAAESVIPQFVSSETPSSQLSIAYSPSEYDNESSCANSEIGSRQYPTTFDRPNTHLPQTAKVYRPITLQSPQLQISQIPPALRIGRAPPHAKQEFDENFIYPKYDTSLHLRALNTRRKNALSWNECIHGPENSTGHMSYQAPISGMRNDGNTARVASWQNVAERNMYNSPRPLNLGLQGATTHHRSASSQSAYRTPAPEHERRDDFRRQDMRRSAIPTSLGYHYELEG